MKCILFYTPTLLQNSEYLFAKFFSGIFIVNLIVLIIAFAISFGFVLPGTNQEIVGPFDIKSYLDVYFIYILPNMLFMGAHSFWSCNFYKKHLWQVLLQF